MISEVFNTDCLEYMRTLPDKAFQLAIADPPYGLPKDSTHGRGKLKHRIINTGNIARWDKAPEQEFFDELFRVCENVIIWGGNYFDLPPTRCVICWDKVQPWENFSQIELAWTSFDYPAKLYRFDNRTNDKIHPTQKPVDLYAWCLKTFAKEGDTVLDNCMGSGTTAIACIKEKRHFIGFELNKEYYNKAVQRIKAEQDQLTLF